MTVAGSTPVEPGVGLTASNEAPVVEGDVLSLHADTANASASTSAAIE
jgi:hypothetical protein